MRTYIVDAFTDSLFSGNPAAVCPLGKWLPDATMQHIAFENNLAETAFFVNENDGYYIRWFTPEVEVDLCGHATLAAAHVVFNYLDKDKSEVTFNSRSGLLKVTKNDNLLTLDFPLDTYEPVELSGESLDCFNIKPIETYKGKTDHLFVFKTEFEIEMIIPHLENITSLGGRGVIITAPGRNADFVSRFFAPQAGINEDPVTGSAHTTLTPYWANKMGKTKLTALQLSRRGGKLVCELKNDRVLISGNAVTYLIGDIQITE